MKADLEEISEAEIAQFKKKLKMLKKFKGKHTELISLYVPENADRSNIMGQISEELSQSSNIKSPTTRKNVQGALRKINNFLKTIDFKIPKNGLVVFSGNVSEIEGRENIQLFTVHPPKELKTKLYWCDSEFHLAPLEEMAEPQEFYGIATIDKNESTIALLAGKKYEILAHFTSGISGKHQAGGQCLLPNTLIQLSDGNIVELENCHNPSSVKSADFENFTVKDSFINDKWETLKPEIFEIVTKEPRMEISCSKDHGFFCWKNGKIIEKTAGELHEGEFLLLPEKIHVGGKIQRLEKNFFNSFEVSEKGRKYLENSRKKMGFSQKQLAEKTGLFQANISALELGKFCPRYNTLKKICEATGIDFNYFSSKQCSPNSKLILPGELNKELAQLAGYFTGDGCFEKERIRFFDERKKVIEKYESVAKKLFNANTCVRFRQSKNYFELTVYGKPIVKFLQENFPELCGKKRFIPKKALKSKDDVLAAFIKGIFDAEGYATTEHLALGMNNEKTVKQLQLALLRFGIIASLNRHSNNRNPYSKKTRFTVQIDEKKSLELFCKKMGFTSSEKNEKLKQLALSRSGKSNVRQIIVSGKEIREIIEKHGFKITDFPKVSNFFRNERMMGKQVFENSILGFSKNKKMREELKLVLEKEVLPAKISKITVKKLPAKMIDISVEKRNFIANGLIVHNSAHRFERLHEEAVHEFYKRIAEKLNSIFLQYGDRLKGMIIGGPGITKNYFLNTELLDYRLKKKVIGVLDSSYTDDSGIREIVQKSEDLLKDTDIIKEQQLISHFLSETVKTGLTAYGQLEVEEALAMGKVSMLLLSEGLEWMVYKFQCNGCNQSEEILVKDPLNFNEKTYRCKKCNSEAEVVEEIDYIDFMLEKAQNTNTVVKVVSVETGEGEQFLKGFGGIGAILRYK